MNGVLQRMAQRARGTLPTVEPRSTPLFAASAAEPDAAPLGSASSGLLVEEPAPAEPSETQIDDLPRKRRPVHRDAAHWADAPPGFEKNSEERTATDWLPRPQEAQPETRDSPSRTPLRIATPSVTPTRIATEGHGEGTRTSKSSEPKDVSPIAATLTRLGAEKYAEQEMEVAAESGRGHDNGKEARADAVSEHGSVARAAVARAAPSAASLAAPERTTEPSTEMHISIGTIELRAPRVEARPQPAPFRPRVTLDEFLARRP
jgi:hypothetical protein